MPIIIIYYYYYFRERGMDHSITTRGSTPLTMAIISCIILTLTLQQEPEYFFTLPNSIFMKGLYFKKSYQIEIGG